VDSLDQTIKQKFASGAESNVIPNPPADMKSRIKYDGATLQVEVSPPGFNARLIVGIAAIAIFEFVLLAFFAFPMFSEFGSEGVVTRTSLQVTQGWLVKKTVNITSDSLEECFIGTMGQRSNSQKIVSAFDSVSEIIAVSDSKRISFGAGLARGELAYLLALAKGILVS